MSDQHPRHALNDMHNPDSSDHPELAIYGVAPASSPRSLVDILRATITAHPDVAAIEAADGAITYGELESILDAEAVRLAGLGVTRGSRVGIRVPSGTTDLYVAILATIWAGAAYVPVDWNDPDSRATTVWEEAGVDAVYGENLSLTRMRDDLPAVTETQPPGLDDDAWIIFTSGTTGKPKGVAIPHRSAGAWVEAEARLYLVDSPPDPRDRVMAGLSVGFDASCEEMWLAWRYGATLVAADRDTVRAGDVLGDWIIEQGITIVSTVPTLAAFWPSEAFDKVRLLIFGGEACPLELVERLVAPGREVWNTYGPTETTVIVSGQLMTPDPPVRIGRPIPGWELAVVDTDGVPVKWGEIGELVVGGVGLGRYLDREKDSEVYAPLPALGWERAYRTGDLVQAEHEGLIFHGRADDQIKFAGRRLELGEVDSQLTALPDVRVGSAALHKTAAGSDVLVGYLVAERGTTIDLADARARLATTLPGGIVPTLCVLDDMPMKTSGKVDRKALPWPLPDTGREASELPAELTWLAERWAAQLGPVPLSPDSDFFDMGGSSVAIAKLAAELRRKHPGVDIADLYLNRTLESMSEYLSTVESEVSARPMPGRLPWYTGLFQAATIMGFYVLNGLRYVIGVMLVIWVLAAGFNAGWVRAPALLTLIPLILAWLLLFSIRGRFLTTAVVSRLLTWRIRPGTYRRGGMTHLRVWAAERFLTFQRLDAVLGTPQVRTWYRLLGNRVGKRADLHSFPPVTGLLTIGDDVSIEAEVDLQGHWIDGDRFMIGTIDIENGVRVGTRTVISPDTRIGEGAEILPGSHVSGSVERNKLWGGSPLRILGEAGQNWPVEDAHTDRSVHHLGKITNHILHAAGLFWITLLPLLAIGPGVGVTFTQVQGIERYPALFPVLATWIPLIILLTISTWLTLVVVTVRLMSLFIKPGYFPAQSATGWALWLTQALLERTLTSSYFMYASWVTPIFMRLMGAQVGKATEISTVVTIPHLTTIGDSSFIADHALLSAPRYRAGWVHVGTTVVGEGSFVGNSGIVGPDRDLPPESLVAVLSSTPYQPSRGTSWLGRRPVEIPRKRIESDSSATFAPLRRLKLARAVVESFRLLPAMIAAWLDLAIVFIGTIIYMHWFYLGYPGQGLAILLLVSGPLVLVAGIIASLIPVLVKWLVVGVFRAGERTLFSTFVWRSELADNFVEPLAVPSLVRMSLGSPMFNMWARLMGTRIGRDVWCESWWLPEFDLITIEDRCTVNRGTVLQTHLFHDRVMSIEPVLLRQGSTLGPNSFLLPGASIGERSTIGPCSLVLRQDAIPSDSVWAGNPVQRVTEPAPQAKKVRVS